jgi:hypothetical protein
MGAGSSGEYGVYTCWGICGELVNDGGVDVVGEFEVVESAETVVLEKVDVLE